MPGDPAAPENQQPANEPAQPAEAPKVDVVALQAELAKNREQLAQAAAALAAIQADRQAPANQPPQEQVPEVDPALRAQFAHLVKTEMGPMFQQVMQHVQQLSGWRSGQELRQVAQEIDLPTELETEVQNLMGQYANAGRPISHQTALANVLGMREMNRMRQEAQNKRAKSHFNTSIMPAFSGAGGLPNLQPLNGQRPKDNDIAGWAQLADTNDLPL
jgi:hypothetical protein